MSVLGIDLGTSVCKAAVFAVDGRRLAAAAREYATLHPAPGRAELDAEEVWRKTREINLVNFMLGCEPVCNNSHANRTLLFDLDANDCGGRSSAATASPCGTTEAVVNPVRRHGEEAFQARFWDLQRE